MDYKNAFDFFGKVAVVTGAAQSIGKEIATAFAACGASVAILDVNEAAAHKTVASLPSGGGEHKAVFCDVSKTESIRAAVDEVVGKYGKIDCLANNAGIAVQKRIQDITIEEWDMVHSINLRGNFYMAKTVGEHMIRQGGGKIVNTASSSSVINSKTLVAYASTKAAVAHITRTFAHDWAEYNINVNAISPGFIATDLIRDNLKDKEWVKANTARIPMGRLGEPDELAGAVLFLSSPLASYVTGVNLVIDGGRTLY